jgi:hypothetical protein
VRGRTLLAASAAVALLVAPASAASAAPSAGATHVFVIVMENRDAATALADPGIAALARRWGLATRYYATAHPSLPNYLALAGGSTFGVSSDCVTCYVRAPNLESRLVAAHVTFGAYLEGVPGPCFLAPWGGNDYAAKHNPFRYFVDVRSSRALCSRLRPLTDLAVTLRSPASAVPRFVWVTPSLCHDGHDCSTATASAWLRAEVALITSSAAWRSGGALFVTWDEGAGDLGVRGGRVVAGAGGGQVATLVIAPHTAAGARLATPLNHYSLLGTVEDLLGVARLGRARGAGTLAPLLGATGG